MTMLTRRGFGVAGAALTGLGLLRPQSLFGAETPPQAVAIDPLDVVADELRPALAKIPPMEFSEKTLPDIRRMSADWTPAPLAQPAFSERRIPGPPGAPDVKIVVVGAAAKTPPRPAVLHIHGGGYVTGAVDDAIPALQRLSAAHGCVVVSVEYRLAPETRFPGSLEDNYAALRWLHANAGELGVDRNRIALLGESAGGGHVAALALAARDRNEVRVAMQIMIYPMLDDRTGSTRPVAPHIGAFIWNAASNRFGWSSLLGVPAGSESVPQAAVPARVENLRGLPPAFIGTGSIDLFVEENIAYAHRLMLAGVPTELFVAPGGYHGFDLIAPEATISKRFIAAWNDALQRGLNTSPLPA